MTRSCSSSFSCCSASSLCPCDSDLSQNLKVKVGDWHLSTACEGRNNHVSASKSHMPAWLQQSLMIPIASIRRSQAKLNRQWNADPEGRGKPLVEGFRGLKDGRQHKVEQRPEFGQAVLDRRPRQKHPVAPWAAMIIIIDFELSTGSRNMAPCRKIMTQIMMLTITEILAKGC